MYTHFKRIMLGSNVVPYIESVLENGRSLSARMLVLQKTWSGCQVFTWLPQDCARENAEKDFNYAKVIPTEEMREDIHAKNHNAYPITEEGDKELASYILSYLNRDPQNICIVENWFGDKSNPWIQKKEVATIFLKKEAYHPLVSENTMEDVVYLIKKTKSIPFYMGILTSRPHEWGAKIPEEIREQDLQLLAKVASAIFVGAYDGDSFIAMENI